MRVLSFFLFAIFAAPNAYSIVNNDCGDGFYRNLGDACPAGSKKATNIPDNYTGRVSSVAESADKVGAAGACACPVDHDKVDLKDGGGWRCIWADEQNFRNVPCVVPKGAGGSGGGNGGGGGEKPQPFGTGAREIRLAVTYEAHSVDKCVAQLNRQAGYADRIENSVDPEKLCNALFKVTESGDEKFDVTEQAFFNFKSLLDCEARVDAFRYGTKSVKRVSGDGQSLEDIPATEEFCKDLYKNGDAVQPLPSTQTSSSTSTATSTHTSSFGADDPIKAACTNALPPVFLAYGHQTACPTGYSNSICYYYMPTDCCCKGGNCGAGNPVDIGRPPFSNSCGN